MLALLGLAQVVTAAEIRLQVDDYPEKGIEYLGAASLLLQSRDKPDATPQDLIAAARADYGRMLMALYDMGHYGGVVSIRVDGREAADISPLASIDAVQQIVIRVDPGPIFTFSEASISPLSPATAVPEGFATGSRAVAGVLNQTSDAAIEGWRYMGHAKAEITDQQIIADHRNATLSASFRLSPGPRLTFGNLNVETTGRVNPERIRQIAGLPTGEVFFPEEVDKAATRLRRTGAFRSVTLEEADEIGPGDTLDINVSLVDAKPRRVGVGVELFSLEGLKLSGFWMHRNLLGGAERLRFDAEISGIGGNSGGTDYSFKARFDRPATFTPDTGLFLEASISEDNEPDYRERNARIGGGLTHIFTDKISGELGIAYQYTDIDDALGSRTLEQIFLPGRLTYDGRNDPLDATSGSFIDLGFSPFLGVGSDIAGARLYLDARTYKRFGPEERFVIAARAQLGSVFGASIADVPPNMLFYSGGAGTVRGQPYQSLGVDLPGGLTIGGRSFFGLSGELRSKLWGPWSVVGFADAGYVASDSFGEQNGSWHSGGGIGARYKTGFGPVRVDIATPFDSDAGRDFELYIGIGQAF